MTVLESVGSTNTELVNLARQGAADSRVLLAEQQGSGRGRLGRDWVCPRGAGLLMSVLTRLPELPSTCLSWPGALLGLATVRALGEVAGVHAELKWPNDVLVDGCKIAGILAELADVTAGAVVTGIGINVDLHAQELPRDDATSLRLLGAAVSREVLAGALLKRYGELIDRLRATEGDAIEAGLLAEYAGVLGTLGREVCAQLPGGAVMAGTARAIEPDGALVIEDGAGVRRAVHAGDVVHLR